MKTILALIGGSGTDDAVFATAFAAAKPFGAHLEVLHVRLDPGEAALSTPHVAYAMGAALRQALDELKTEAEMRSIEAAQHFQQFCAHHAVLASDMPIASPAVTAAWREESGPALARMMRSARHNDLVVLARSDRPNGLPRDLIELLLVDCGRPVLIAPARPRAHLTGTALVCWKESATAARALGAALPLLSQCRKVIVVGVEEDSADSQADLRDLAHRLSWHGIRAELDWVSAGPLPAAGELQKAAERHDADLLVMGGYGHGRARELVFGGCTRHFLAQADRPLLLMH